MGRNATDGSIKQYHTYPRLGHPQKKKLNKVIADVNSNQPANTRNSAQHGIIRNTSAAHLKSGRIHWFNTFCQTDNHQTHGIQLRKLIHKQQRPPQSHHHMILLDTSASSLNQQALSLAKGVIIGLGENIYLARQRLSLIQFGNNRVNTVYHHSRPPKNIQSKIDAITAGGGTPLRNALLQAQKQLKDIKKRRPNEWQSLYIFTDGRSQEPYTDINFASDTLLFIDTELDPISLARCQTMAQFFKAEYVRLTDIPLKDYLSTPNTHKTGKSR